MRRIAIGKNNASLCSIIVIVWTVCFHRADVSSSVNVNHSVINLLQESDLNDLLTPAEWRNIIGPYYLPDKSISPAIVNVKDVGNYDGFDKIVFINATNFATCIDLRLTRNVKLADSNLLVLVRTENSTNLIARDLSKLRCFYKSVSQSSYYAALDLCGGARGIILSNTGDYYTISPLPRRLLRSEDDKAIDHILVKLNPNNYEHVESDSLSFDGKYNFKQRRKRNVTPSGGDGGHTDNYDLKWMFPNNVQRLYDRFKTINSNNNNNNSNHHHHRDSNKRTYQCGNTYIDKTATVDDHNHWRRQRRRRNIIANVSDVHIETAVFVDRDLFDHMKINFPIDTEAELIRFVMALINAVELLYHDPSLGLTVNFVLKRLEILHVDPTGLIRSHDIDRFLSNFCNWQHSENPVGDDDPLHWDHAVILTGLDLYVLSKNGKITNQVVGLAPVAGMCTATSSCTVNEGRHFESAYVVAHEIGHNLGMRHDGASADNNCDPSGYLMSPTLGSGKITWSTCSRHYLERFLESKQSRCLMDKGITSDLLDHRADGILPGERFNAHQQCKLKYGNNSVQSISQSLEDVCKDLHCSRDRYTWTSHPALEGTVCGLNKWCRSGRCVEKGLSAVQAGYAPNQVVNGAWSKWSIFSDCASSCLYGNSNGLLSGSTGIMIAARRCNNPRPENGGELCSGSDQKYKTCTAPQCNSVKKVTLAEFANELCSRASQIDSELTGFGNYRISTDSVEACAVWCYKKNGGYKSRGSYPDGTVCQMKRYRKFTTYCIKGTCREFVCNKNHANVIYSHSEEFCHHQPSRLASITTSTTSSIVASTGTPSTKSDISTIITSTPTTTNTANTTSINSISTTSDNTKTEIVASTPSDRDKRKEFLSGEWIPSSSCFYNCIVPGSGIKIVEKKLCPFCNVTVNVQSCQPLKQVCGRIKSVLEHATVVCNKYSQRVRRLSGLGMQLSQTTEDPHRPCRLACQDESVSHRFYLVNGEDGWFPFGTDCTRGDTTRTAYCINGKCLEFGRDNTPLYDYTYSVPLSSRIKRDDTSFNRTLPFAFDPTINDTLQNLIHYLKYGQYLNMKKTENKFSLDFSNPVHIRKEDLQSNRYLLGL